MTSEVTRGPHDERDVRGRRSRSGDERSTRWFTPTALTVVGVVVCALSVATFGFPAMLVLAGSWSFAAITSRWSPALAGPASWAAGLAIETTLVIGESAAMAIVDPHPHPQFVYVVALILPLVVAGALYWYLGSVARPRTRTRTRAARVSAEPWLAVLGVVLIELMFDVVRHHGHNYGLTWFMGGDGRNHVALDRSILAAGGITLKEMTSYPALVNAMAAMIGGAGGRANLSTSVLLVRDVEAMNATVILSCIGIALFFAAAVAETFSRGTDYVRRLPLYLLIPLGACGSVALGAWIFGLSASGGFLSAIGCLVYAMAAVVLGLRISRHYDDLTLVLLTVLLFLVVAGWTFLVVVPLGALLVGYVGALARLRHRARDQLTSSQARRTAVVASFSVLCVVAVALALLHARGTLVTQLKTGGGIVGPNPRLFVGLGVIAVVSVLSVRGWRNRVVRLQIVVVYLLMALTVVVIRSLHPGGVSWSYYATKMIWLATGAMLWVPFVILVDVVRLVHDAVSLKVAQVSSVAALAVAGSGALLWGIGHETPFPWVWGYFYDGQTIPSPFEVQLVMHEADLGGPFVIWQESTPFEDQLGNFWAALTWEYEPNGTVIVHKGTQSFVNWASSEHGSFQNLCWLVSHYQMRVVTKNPSLIPTLWWRCPTYRPIASQARPAKK